MTGGRAVPGVAPAAQLGNGQLDKAGAGLMAAADLLVIRNGRGATGTGDNGPRTGPAAGRALGCCSRLCGKLFTYKTCAWRLRAEPPRQTQAVTDLGNVAFGSLRLCCLNHNSTVHSCPYSLPVHYRQKIIAIYNFSRARELTVSRNHPRQRTFYNENDSWRF